MSKINSQKVKKAIPIAALRLLPVGALFLPLGTLTFNLGGLGEMLGLGDLGGLLAGLLGGGGKGTSYNIVGLIQGMLGQDSNGLLGRLMQQDFMAGTRIWLYMTGAGLALGILATLAGFAFIFAEKVKHLAASAAVYGAGTLGGICAVVGFLQFGVALGPALLDLAIATLNYGAWVWAAMLLLNLIVCLVLWRGVKERERLTALARKQKKKK